MTKNFKNFLYGLSFILFISGALIINEDLDNHNCTNLAAEFRGNGKLYGKQCLITTATGHKLPVEIR